VAPPPRPRANLTLEASEPWRAQAAPADAALIDSLAARWEQALGQALGARLGGRIAAQGALLDPKTALARAAPAPGPYACRAVRFPPPGIKARWEEAKGFFCFVGAEADGPSLTVDGGPRRLGGYLSEEKGGSRLIFLGAGRGKSGPLRAYGEDPAADAVGVLERTAEFRYRLAVPGRNGDLTVYEMVAAPR
jgi:hypothetical protein